jgi:hypothetical protein
MYNSVHVLPPFHPPWALSSILTFPSAFLYPDFSICLDIFGFPEKQENGAKSIICQNDNAPPRGRLYYWAYIFYISKYYEFADTIFLALKKKPLEFLHCYHHAIVPTGCWLGLAGWKLPLSLVKSSHPKNPSTIDHRP